MSGVLLQTVGITVGSQFNGSVREKNRVNTKQTKNNEHARLLWHATWV